MFFDPNAHGECSSEAREIVCWSRMQAEAGQQLSSILARKELERLACDGLFFWGVGNAPGSEPTRLARLGVPIQAVFSVMKSRPKMQDANASDLNVWRRFIDEHGDERELPDGVLITSRAAPQGARQRSHYALMCRSDERVALRDMGPFNPKAFRNVGGRGAPVGASQVTALLRLFDAGAPDSAGYRTNLRATLTGGYWVKLSDPVRLGGQRTKALLGRLDEVAKLALGDWLDLVSALRTGPRLSLQQQATLFTDTSERVVSSAAAV